MTAFLNHIAALDSVITTHVLGDLNITPNPLLTIWIPTYKRDAFLRAAIDSALNQENPQNIPYEIIVIDNDGAQKKESIAYQVVESYHNPAIILYQNSENTGLFGNWNKGIKMARAPWCVMLHDDDLLFPNFIRVMSVVVSQENPPDIIGNMNTTFKNSLTEITYDASLDARLEPVTLERFRYKYRPIGIAGLTVRRAMALEIGGYDSAYYPSSDWEFYARALSASFRIARVVGVPISAYRAALNTSSNPNTKLYFTIANYKIWTHYHLTYPDAIRAFCIEKKRKFRIFITAFRNKNVVDPDLWNTAQAMLTLTDCIIGWLSPKTWIACVRRSLGK